MWLLFTGKYLLVLNLRLYGRQSVVGRNVHKRSCSGLCIFGFDRWRYSDINNGKRQYSQGTYH